MTDWADELKILLKYMFDISYIRYITILIHKLAVLPGVARAIKSLWTEN